MVQKNPKITQLGVCFSVQHWYTRSQEREIPNPLSFCTDWKLKCHHWMFRVSFLARTCEFQAWNMMSPCQSVVLSTWPWNRWSQVAYHVAKNRSTTTTTTMVSRRFQQSYVNLSTKDRGNLGAVESCSNAKQTIVGSVCKGCGKAQSS